jgi:hypothetical protein
MGKRESAYSSGRCDLLERRRTNVPANHTATVLFLGGLFYDDVSVTTLYSAGDK